MIRFILIFILLYILYRGIKVFMKYFKEYSRSQINDPGKKESAVNKYSNVKDAEFTEIKSPGSEENKKNE